MPCLFSALLSWIAFDQYSRSGSTSILSGPLPFAIFVLLLPWYLLRANRIEVTEDGVRVVMPLGFSRFIPYSQILTSQLSTGRHAPHQLSLFDRRPSMRVRPFCSITLAIYSRSDALWLVDLPEMKLNKWV